MEEGTEGRRARDWGKLGILFEYKDDKGKPVESVLGDAFVIYGKMAMFLKWVHQHPLYDDFVGLDGPFLESVWSDEVSILFECDYRVDGWDPDSPVIPNSGRRLKFRICTQYNGTLLYQLFDQYRKDVDPGLPNMKFEEGEKYPTYGVDLVDQI